MVAETAAVTGSRRSATPARGRRRKVDGSARDDIVRATQGLFFGRGIHDLSIRAIARDARVDPALVIYYFGSREELLLETLGATLRPLLKGVFGAGALAPGLGANVVTEFLQFWDAEGRSKTFAALVQIAASGGRLANGLREILTSVLASQFSDQVAQDELPARVSLVATQMFGLGTARYVFRLEPIASASIDSLARSIGPTIDRYLTAPRTP